MYIFYCYRAGDSSPLMYSLEFNKIKQCISEHCEKYGNGFDLYLMYCCKLDDNRQNISLGAYHQYGDIWNMEGKKIPEQTPLQEFATAIINEDPVACDAVRDILRI